MKVSIIVAVYNVVSYVERCIESIILQTYRDIEIIVIDDGSSDGSKQKCQELADKDGRIVFFSQRNQGVSVARNEGIKRASGDYIAFVDGDDYLDKAFVEEMVCCAEDNLDAEIIFCGYKYDSYGNIEEYGFFDRNRFFSEQDRDMLICRAIGVYEDNLKRRTHIGTPWAKLYKKRFILDNNIWFDKGMPRMQDLIFNVRCFQKLTNGVYIDKKLYSYVFRNDSTANGFNQHYEDEAKLIIYKLDEATKGTGAIVAESVKYKAILLLIEAIRLKYAKKECGLSLYEKREGIKALTTTEPFSSAICCKYKHINNSFGRNMFLRCIRFRRYLFAYILVKIKYKGR